MKMFSRSESREYVSAASTDTETAPTTTATDVGATTITSASVRVRSRGFLFHKAKAARKRVEEKRRKQQLQETATGVPVSVPPSTAAVEDSATNIKPDDPVKTAETEGREGPPESLTDPSAVAPLNKPSIVTPTADGKNMGSSVSTSGEKEEILTLDTEIGVPISNASHEELKESEVESSNENEAGEEQRDDMSKNAPPASSLEEETSVEAKPEEEETSVEAKPEEKEKSVEAKHEEKEESVEAKLEEKDEPPAAKAAATDEKKEAQSTTKSEQKCTSEEKITKLLMTDIGSVKNIDDESVENELISPPRRLTPTAAPSKKGLDFEKVSSFASSLVTLAVGGGGGKTAKTIEPTIEEEPKSVEDEVSKELTGLPSDSEAVKRKESVEKKPDAEGSKIETSPSVSLTEQALIKEAEQAKQKSSEDNNSSTEEDTGANPNAETAEATNETLTAASADKSETTKVSSDEVEKAPSTGFFFCGCL